MKPEEQESPGANGPVETMTPTDGATPDGGASHDKANGNGSSKDPLRTFGIPLPHVCEGDHVILMFSDGRRLFAHCVHDAIGRTPPVRIGKRTYSTYNLIGLHYGTVLEVGPSSLIPLPEGEGLFPKSPLIQQQDSTVIPVPLADEKADDEASLQRQRDNRDITDCNTSQGLGFEELQRLRDAGVRGSVIVEKMIENSATFGKKSDFSQAKYIARKQMKYQLRCRILRCTASSICSTLYLKDPKKMMNLREDTLGQILSYANLSAGCQTLVLESTFGVVTGAVAERLGGYGKILSIYSGQQPAWTDMIQKYNLSFAEHFSIKWLHSGDVFGEGRNFKAEYDPERTEREVIQWPCPLQDHTRDYIKQMKTREEKEVFLEKRAARFTRKLTRHTPDEAKEWLLSRQSDSVIIVARHNPTEVLLELLPFLAPSCPFVVYSEFMEPLTHCFLALQRDALAVNLRLSDVWTREYQVLPSRTHPVMDMSQSGGFLLTGIKLDPKTGNIKMDEELLREIRAQLPGRRGRKKKKPSDAAASGQNEDRPTDGKPSKRTRKDE